MNKTIIALGVLLSVITGCETAEVVNGFTLNMILRGAEDSTTVKLLRRIDGENVAMDSTFIINESAIFNGTLKGLPEGYYLAIDGKRRSISFFLENSNIEVIAHIDSLNNAKVSGSELNNLYAEFNDDLNKIQEKMRPLYGDYSEAEAAADSVRMAEIDSIFYALSDERTMLNLDFISNNLDNILGPYLVGRIYYNDDKLSELDSITQLFDSKLDSSKYVKNLKDNINTWKSLQIGMKAPLFEQEDSSGNILKLSDLRGKYLLVDFWASWCGPCRAENPNIVKAYNEYKEKGFDILGVSLDTDRQKWLKAIEKDGLSWNHVSDLNGWNNAVSQSYSIRAIPYSLLLDPDGIIIAKNPRGDNLHEELSRALGD